MHECVRGCMSVCISMTAFTAVLLGQLILSHLRSWVRIIKPISRRWLLQPACDWITTQPLPSALQGERMSEEKNETQGKKEMRKDINKESRQWEPSGGWKRNSEDETEREHRIKIVFPISLCSLSYIYYQQRSALNRFTLCVACVGYPSYRLLSIFHFG